MSEVKWYEAPDMAYMHVCMFNIVWGWPPTPQTALWLWKNQGTSHTEPCLLLKIHNLKYKAHTWQLCK